MQPNQSFMAFSIALALAACGSDKNNNLLTYPGASSATSKKLELVLPKDGATLEEDFPLALYVTYADDTVVVDAITSIDVNWPQLDVHQSNKEYGYIDGGSESLSYYTVDQPSKDSPYAVDLERQDTTTWMVSGNNELLRYSKSSDTTRRWRFAGNAEFTELAIDEEGENNLWLYNKFAHHLVHFDAQTEAITTFALNTDIHINGLAISGSHFLILAKSNANPVVMLFDVDNTELSHRQSWYLSGFAVSEFNDIGLLPNGEIIVSTTDAQENIFVVRDKSQHIGAGPIADSGELILVEQIPLPENVAQPSGLWSMFDNSWLLITDQAEVFLLDSDFKTQEKVDIVFNSTPCNQGCTEAIVGGVDEFFALTDSGLIGQFNRVDGTFQLTQEHHIQVVNEHGELYEYSGLGKDVNTAEYFLVPDQSGEDQQDVLIILNEDFTLKEQHILHFPAETDGSIFEYDAQGVVYQDGFVYVISGKFTKVLKINLSGEIIAVFDLDDEVINDPSDLAIREGLIYILGDHENDEAVPPVSVFEIQ